MVVGRLLSYWEGIFSGAMLNFGKRVIYILKFDQIDMFFLSNLIGLCDRSVQRMCRCCLADISSSIMQGWFLHIVHVENQLLEPWDLCRWNFIFRIWNHLKFEISELILNRIRSRILATTLSTTFTFAASQVNISMFGEQKSWWKPQWMYFEWWRWRGLHVLHSFCGSCNLVLLTLKSRVC